MEPKQRWLFSLGDRRSSHWTGAGVARTLLGDSVLGRWAGDRCDGGSRLSACPLRIVN